MDGNGKWLTSRHSTAIAVDGGKGPTTTKYIICRLVLLNVNKKWTYHKARVSKQRAKVPQGCSDGGPSSVLR